MISNIATFTIPNECSRCELPKKVDEYMLPVKPPQYYKKKLVMGYTPIVYLCKDCGKKFIDYINRFFNDK